MRVGIHYRKDSFSDHWIKYCIDHKIDYKLVNCYEWNIVDQLRDCDALIWHHSHVDYRDVLFAKALLYSIEQSGKAVFPNFKTGWHFDDKVGQKYLLESINAPTIGSYVFYEKDKASEWAKKVQYPMVFKLRGGAGASNVRLIKDSRECIQVINKAFGRGFSQYQRWQGLKDRISKYKNKNASLKYVLGGFKRLILPNLFEKMAKRERGYVYFQDFIPNNEFDMRIIVIGGKYAYGMKRQNRKDDFRASGSSNFIYDNIPISVIESAFTLSKQLELQAIAFDYILDDKKKPLVIEMSYGFGLKGSSKCPGYWSDDLKWHEGCFDPFGWMIEDLLDGIRTKEL